MRAKLPFDLEAEFHEMIREGASILTKGNKTQFLREAIQTYYNEAMRNKED